jgi:hypothetical protein
MEEFDGVKTEEMEDADVMREVSCFCRAPEPRY